LHTKKVKKLASKFTLPILANDKKVMNEFCESISYLDQTFPENTLTPENESLQKAALEWELFTDKELGPDARSLHYHTLLDHTDITLHFLSVMKPGLEVICEIILSKYEHKIARAHESK
jgi:glutathione S-transferase